MRKFTLLFAFLLSLIGVAQAQTVIKDLANLSNDKLYVLSTSRGTLQVNDAGDGLVAVETADNANPKQQFAVLKYSSDSYYLYHPLTQKCVSEKLLGKPSVVKDAAAVTFVAHEPGGTASGKFVMKNGGNFYNMDNNRNLFVDGWSTHDDGNGFTITEVGDFGDAEKVKSLFDWTATTAPQLSTAISPICYVIENLRSNKFAAHTLIGSALKQTTDITDAGAMWYFVDATDAVPDGVTLGEGVKAVYIRNLFSNLGLQSAVGATYADPGKIYYLIPHTVGDKSGFVISENTTVGVWTAWNEKNGTEVCNYSGNDAGSLWSFYPALSSVKTQAQSGIPALVGSNLQSFKNSAIAEAEAEGARPYYACSEKNIEACKTTINSQTATTYEECVTAKTYIANALSTLRGTERIKPLQGGEIVIIHNRKNAQRYITTDAAEETAAAEVSLVKGKATVDTRSLWIVVDEENGKFKLCNALSGKYIQHQGDNNLTLVNAENATAYAFINKENHWILIDAGDVGNRHVNIRDWEGAEGVAGWTDETDQGNHWEIIAPTAEQLARLVELQTPIETLKAEAVKQLENKIEAFKNENNALDFYNVSAEAITVCENAIKAEIQNVTTHAALEVIKNGMDAAIAQLWNSAGNRTNPLTAGVKVRFRNKAVAENYMTVDADGATTSATVTSASIWTLVAGESDAYYLYNPLNNTYLKHATVNGGQATMVSDKAEASLYQVTPSGKHVLIGLAANDPYAAETDRDYVHCNDPEVYVTRFTENSDRSLWTVTKVSDDDATALETEIQTILTERYSAAYAEVNNMVEGFRVLDFYRPEAAIAAYDEAVKNLTAPTTFDELDAAIATLLAAKTAFEAAVNEAVTNGTLSPVITNGVQVKLLNREYSTRYMSSTDNKTVSAIEEQTSETIWQFVENDEKTGFYLFNPLMNLYVKHPTGGGTTAATLVADRAEASLYTVTPEDFLVKLAAEGYSGTEEYLNLNGWLGNFNVVRWEANGVANNAASYWALKNVTEAELTQLAADIKTEAAAQLEEYKDAKRALVEQYEALTNYGVAEAAVTAFETALAGITTEEYANLADKKAAVDAAFATLEATRATTNPLVAEQRVTFKNVANPTLFMTATAAGVDAIEQNYLENYWTLKAATDGFYLYNEAAQKYVLHPAANGSQAKLVSTADSASVYSIEPTEMSVFLRAVAYKDTTDCLHYGSEHYVTRWYDDMDASKWGFEVVSAEQFQALLAHDLDSCKQLALLRIGVAAKSAFYAPTADAISAAQTSVEAVDAAAVATLADFKVAMESINAAMTTMYSDGLNNGASPQGSNKLLRLRNKLYPTHFLGFGEDGLYHYETVETGGNVMPVDDDVDPGMTSGEVDILHSTESTIWNLETPTGSVPDERMYLKNVMIQSYAEHQYYDNWHVKLALKQAEAHPEIIELVGVVRDTDNNMSIKYEDMNFAESGEKCFLVYTTEGTSSTNNALFAAQNGTIVNGARTSDASMWTIAEATDIECANMGDYSVFAYHQYVFAPTINMAKQYYCETTETVEDEEGNTSTVTTVVDYIDGAKAGYYHYAGGIKDGEGNEITDIEEFQTYYWTCLKQAIDLDAASEAGVHNPAEAMDIVNILNENMAALVLNRPNRDGFFRIRCVHNNHYLQSDDLNKDGRLDLSEDNTGIASIFYFDALDGEGNDGKGSLVSYKEGYYFTQGSGTNGHSGIYVCLQPIGKMGDVLTLDVPANKEFGSYNISSDNTQNQNGRRYLFGAAGNKTDGYYPDNGSDATQVNVANDLGGNTGYNWVLERVEELPLTINSYGYSTFYAPVALNVPEGVEAFICTGVDEQSELTLQSLDVIPAGTAVILKAEELAGQEVYFTEPNNTPMPLAEGENYLHGGIYKTWRTPECQNKNPEMTSATGVNHNLPYLEENVTDKVYTLSNKNGKVAMYQYAGNKFTHFRSFLKLPEAINVALASTLDFGEIIEGPTAIEEAPAISLEDAIIYDLSGRRVAEPGKGVYIVNGKKVYFK